MCYCVRSGKQKSVKRHTSSHQEERTGDAETGMLCPQDAPTVFTFVSWSRLSLDFA